MTRKRITTFLSIITLCLEIASCEDILGNNDNSLTGGADDLKTGQIEMKVDPYQYNNKVSFKIAAQKISIDWGDGTVEETVLSGSKRNFEHEYANSNPRTIKVNTEYLISFGIGLYSSDGGQFNELRFGNCPKLEELACAQDSWEGTLTVLEINRAESLMRLDCSGGRLTTLNVNGCPALTELECYSNQLTSLDVSKCTALTSLSCGSNRLTSLNVKGCTALASLDCSYNQLTSLNVNGYTALTELYCYENQLTSLDVSKCTTLSILYCSSPNIRVDGPYYSNVSSA
jgi:Leucine-rich repeat (LRR) protein